MQEAYVQAYTPEFFADENMRDGEFSVGPLPAGPFQVVAKAGAYADSEPLSVEAGASDLVLRLRPGAGVGVRVLGADGGRGSGLMLWAVHEQHAELCTGTFTDEAGEVALTGLLPGTWTLTASDPSGGFGVLHGVPLTAGVDPPTVVLQLELAARLRLSVPTALTAGNGVRILRAGREVAFAIPSESPLVSVPAGELEVQLVRWTATGPEPLQIRRVTARLGEETAVEFDAP
jgi:hypothetical protein